MKGAVVFLMSCLIALFIPQNVHTRGFTPALAQTDHRDAAWDGEAAVGHLIKEEKDKSKLQLDVIPCREPGEASRIITFSKVYKKKSLGKMSCFDGRTYEAFQVVQVKRR
jgi:hypothetical protein